jgi:hypothetical protein
LVLPYRLKKLEDDHELVVDGAVAQALLVAVGHKFQDFFALNLIDIGFWIGLAQERIKRVAIRKVGAGSAVVLDEIEIRTDGCAYREPFLACARTLDGRHNAGSDGLNFK